MRTDAVKIDIWGIKDYKFIDHYQYDFTFAMTPSATAMVVNSITSSSLEEGHTNVTISFNITMANLMDEGYTLKIDFPRDLYPLWSMSSNIACSIPTPSNFQGTCLHSGNGFLITVNTEYDFNTNYNIEISGIIQTTKDSIPSFAFNTFTKAG